MSFKSYSSTPLASSRGQNAPANAERLLATLCSTTLNVVGESAAEDRSPYNLELSQALKDLSRQLATSNSEAEIEQIGWRIESELREWGKQAALDKRQAAEGMKKLLAELAQAFDSLGARTNRYADRFSAVTGDLDQIAALPELPALRKGLVQQVEELKHCIGQMKEENQQAIEELRSELSSYEKKLIRAEDEALKDALTGLANRRGIEERLTRSIANEWTICVALFDLNRFKQVNDELGHLAGDDLLRQFSQRLQAQAQGGDLAGRWGGDEFVVVFQWCDLAEANARVEKIKAKVQGPYALRTRKELKPVEVTVAAAVGVAQWEPGLSMQELLQQADARMYAQKQARP